MSMTTLHEFTADHRDLLALVAKQGGFADPVTIDLDEYFEPILKLSKKGQILPIDGVLVRDWDPDNRKVYAGIQLGMRLYTVQGIKFARVHFNHSDNRNGWCSSFTVIDRKDYASFYRIGLKARKDSHPEVAPPVLPTAHRETLWKNTIGYLERDNLRRIKAYGGRPKRGVLLMGPPGNGKTSACRWLWQECRRRNWEWHLVTPDAYSQARRASNPVEAVKNLFTVEKAGIVFFDDMDIALRDRESVRETDDQAVFLSALDGITTAEGVVFVFTTNCGLELIDRAFKRPGRIDLVLQFNPPDEALRRELIGRWHTEIVASIDLDRAVETTDGFSFAEIEELKNLLILNFMDADAWDWTWALKQLDINRHELHQKRRSVGFASLEQVTRNGI